jgi:glycosyltransferase involved in cell wall biosynthesis
MGIERASGDYIGFQDSDDEWLPTKLQTQVKVLDNSSAEVGVVFTGYWRVMADSRRIYMPIRPPDMNNAMEILLKRFFLFVATPTVLARRQCFSQVGLFDERLPRLQEWELWIRFSQCYRFLYIKEPLVLSHYQQESITSNYEALAASFEMILAKHRQILEQDGVALAELYNIFGRHLLDSRRTFRIGRDYLWQALKLFPTNPWHLGYFLLSCLNFELLAKTKMAYRSLEHKIRSST